MRLSVAAVVASAVASFLATASARQRPRLCDLIFRCYICGSSCRYLCHCGLHARGVPGTTSSGGCSVAGVCVILSAFVLVASLE